jgi:hypothetical protein
MRRRRAAALRAARAMALTALAAGLLGACTSPEATRQRAGGPGADVGNRREPVELHAGAEPYYGTPRAIPGAGGAAVAASPRER